MVRYFDADWYRARYPELATHPDPYQHFIRYGATEGRDPNPFFDGAWYLAHYPDVVASGTSPLLHYAQSGAAELRNPHPRFDAVYYVEQHPEAAADPLLFHLRIGRARGFATERAIEIADYLPSRAAALPVPRGVFVDVIIVVDHGAEETRRCVLSVLADRAFPLARIIVVVDRSATPDLRDWLEELASDGHVHLINSRRRLTLAAAAELGVIAAERHDVVLLKGGVELPAGWLRRLAAHAYLRSNIATVSPLSGDADPILATPATRDLDTLCATVNRTRSVPLPGAGGDCIYIRRTALLAAGTGDLVPPQTGRAAADGFCARASARGWQHRLAFDVFLEGNVDAPWRAEPLPDAAPFRFAMAAALFRRSGLPVVLMISHDLGGGVSRHIDALVQRYHDSARILLLRGTDRGAVLSLASAPDDPLLTLSGDRLDDLVAVLRSTGLTRVHIHHLMQMDMDVRALVQKLGVPFDVTIHDYHAICPQINLLTWAEGFYCGEPGPAGCNACIAGRVSHGARDIVSWRADRAWQFLDADRVICPTADVKARLQRYGLDERAIVVPHEQQPPSGPLAPCPETTRPKLKIALLGVLANHKGARTVAEVAAIAPATIELHLIGHLEDDFPEPSARRIRITGQYRNAELPDLLRRIDPHVLWFPATWPETWSYTLSVAIETGLPIVASDIGSFPERLAGRPRSFLVDHRAPAEKWLATFERVRAALDQPVPSSAPAAGTESDFYANHYLAPTPRPSARRRKPLIAILPERSRGGGLTASAYTRLLLPMDHSAIRCDFDVMTADLQTIFGCAADLIITQPGAIADVELANRLADHARRIGARLAVDLDEDPPIGAGIQPNATQPSSSDPAVRRMLSVADAVWVATPTLASRLASTRPDAIVIETRLDERIWIRPLPGNPLDDPIRILCMGAGTQDQDFELIAPVLLRLKEKYRDRIVVDVIGMTGPGEIPAGLNRRRPSAHAARSYPGLADWLTTRQPGWHIGLAPLRDTRANAGRSPVAALHYAALGMTVLASDTPVYRGSIADGPAGQLVANDQTAWHAALDWLIRNQHLRAAGTARARTAFLAHGTLAGQAETRLAALRQVLPARTLPKRSLSVALACASATLP